MKLYHGTNDPEPILRGGMVPGTWLSAHRFHAFRIAERRAQQHGGEPAVVELKMSKALCDRFPGRRLPTFRFKGGDYEAVAVHRMVATKGPADSLEKTPRVIYLQIEDEYGSLADVSGNLPDEVTWCRDRIYESDVVYIRADYCKEG